MTSPDVVRRIPSDFRTVANGAVTLCTEAFGDKADPAILLVMGATASMVWWPDALCAALADAGRYVVRFDHRDTGASTSVPAGTARYSVDDLADDAIAILDAYSIEAAHFVGMSLGGLVSQLVALRTPRRVLSLTLIAAEPLGGETVDAPEMSPEFLAHFATIEAIDWTNESAIKAFLMRIAALSASAVRGVDMPATAARIDRELCRTSTPRSAFNHAMIGSDLGRWDLSDIMAPTLVIHGAQDPLIPLAKGEAIARQVTCAELHVLPAAGHELHSADLEVISDRVLAHTARA